MKVDFKAITQLTTLYNFHSHTQFCDGRANMEDFVKEAINQGFTHLGFTPHSPISFPSPCNMKIDMTPAYSDEIERLRKLYGDKINIYKSMEIDYINRQWGPAAELFDSFDLDYRLASVHFIPCGEIYVDTDGRFESFKQKVDELFDGDIVHVVNSFYDQTLAMISAGKFDIIGHFDKIGLNASLYCPGIEDEKWYNKRVNEVMEAIKDTQLIAEINTKSLFKHQRTFPHQRYYRQLKMMEIPVVINSDVHMPELINAGREETISKYNNL
ncbi:MAG: histidinol-phosphatase [Candidatus Limisoma sp.]